MAVFGLALGFFVICGALADLWTRAGFRQTSSDYRLEPLKGLPRSAFGTALAHLGLGVTVIGIVAVSTFQTEHVVEMKPGMTAEAGGYVLTFDGMRAAKGPNYTEDQGHFTIRKAGVEVADVWSSKRLYPARRMPTTEAGIVTFGFSSSMCRWVTRWPTAASSSASGGSRGSSASGMARWS